MDILKYISYIIKDKNCKDIEIMKPFNNQYSNELKNYTITGVLMNGIRYRIGWNINNYFIPDINDISKFNNTYIRNKNEVIKEFMLKIKHMKKIKLTHDYLILFNNWNLNNDVSIKIINFIH